MNSKRHVLSFFLAILITGSLSAQDIHFSQFFNSPLNTNPALTGIFNGDIRAGGHFRQQWHNVPVDYLTFSAYADKKFKSKNPDKGFFAGGLLFNYDKAGDSRLTLGELGLSGSYTRILNEKNLITLGLQVGGANTSLDFSQGALQWDNQWDGTKYDALRPTGDESAKQTINAFNLGGGINYRWQKSTRTKIDAGIGAYHFTSPKESFLPDGTSEVPIRLTLNLGGTFQLSDALDFNLHLNGQFQDKFEEYVPAAFISIYVNRKRGKEFKLNLGGIGRLNQDEIDAIAPHVAFEYKNWYLGLSWDANLSEFKTATDRNGGPEVAFRYIITKVKPLENFKNCPIY